MKIKNLIYLAFFGILIAGIYSCGKDDEPATGENINLLSVRLNGDSFSGNITDVSSPVNLEFTFSKAVEASGFTSAFSVSSSGTAPQIAISYTNAGSKAVVTLTGLEAGNSYAVDLRAATIGVQEEQLFSSFSGNFTVKETVVETKTPCTTLTEACLQTLSYELGNGKTRKFNFYSSFDFIDDPDFDWSFISKVVIVFHGQNRDADNYFKFITNTISQLNIDENTLLIAPFFAENNTSDSDNLFWDSNWREGANSSNTSAALSSFSVIDEIISSISSSEKFSLLDKIYITGHSSGADFVQHYAISTDVEGQFPQINFSYSVANNQYFYYPTQDRYDEATGQYFIPTDCAGFNFWPYGYEFAPDYLAAVSEEAVLQNLISREIVYFQGTEDVQTEGTLNTKDCQAVLLGSNRLERGKNLFRYLNDFYPENNSSPILVPNIGHDAEGIYSSQEFKDYLLD